MIRPSIPNASRAIIALAVAAGLSAADETEALGKVLADYFDGNGDDGHTWITDEEEGELRGVAYYAPELIADRVWNLYMIAVHPDCQGQGRGSALLRFVEKALQARDDRLLLVDTSSLPKYERTRAFYRKCGYEEEARIRDFWAKGDDKIVFRKVLSAE